MADKDVLSQEEIDALLENVDEDGDEAQVTADGGKGPLDEQVQTMNFGNRERITKGQLPVLEKIYDRAKRFFAAEIYQLTGHDFDIEQEPLAVVKHSEYMASLANPSLMTTYRFKPLRGKGMVLFDSIFVYCLVDYYFGGHSQFKALTARSDFTATELKVMNNVTDKLVQNLTKAWEHVLSLHLEKVTAETNPSLIHISEPDEMLLHTKFNINFGEENGSFSLVVPFSMIEPVRQQLELGATRPDDEIDPNWIKSLKEEIMGVNLLLSSTMAEAESSLGKVYEWKTGDFIPLDKKEIVTLDVEGTPGFEVSIGTAGEKRALKIIKKISYY